MSVGDRQHGAHPIRDEERRAVEALLRQPKFRAAYRRYTRQTDAYHVPWFAGSDKAGTAVFYDPTVPRDRRRFIRVHEVVEGILIREYGFDYTKAHRYATIAERMAVERAGLTWSRYQGGLEPLIHACEREPVRDTPPTLLTKAYEGTPIMAKLNAAARKKLPAKDFAGPDRSYPVEDKNHARDALSRASEMRNRGELSDKAYGNIVAKAKAKLGKGKKRDADGDYDGDQERGRDRDRDDDQDRDYR